MGKLDGKVTIITGASTGLGKQYARRFAYEGAKVAICARTESKLMDTKKLCEKEGAEVLAFPCDVTQYDELKAFVDATVERFGTIDALVNNAHDIALPRGFFEYDIPTLDNELHSSLYATWHMMKLCFPYMKDKGGSIINIASRGGLEGTENHAAYAAAKEAIRGLSRVVAREWGPHNIRVNIICPVAWTDILGEKVKLLEPELQEWVKRDSLANVFHRYGDPYLDVAPAVVFLASDDSRWITGQTLCVDGGLWMGP